MLTTCRYQFNKVLNPETNKHAMRMLTNYFSWDKESSIFSIYGKPCDKNIKAYYRLRDDMAGDNGYDFRCGNPTCHSWCCAYRIPGHCDSSGKSDSYLIYHTRDNVYAIHIPTYL